MADDIREPLRAPHIDTRPDGSLMPCTCPRDHDHTTQSTPVRAITSNRIANAIERIQGFTVLDVRYAIADEVIDGLISLGWVPPERLSILSGSEEDRT